MSVPSVQMHRRSFVAAATASLIFPLLPGSERAEAATPATQTIIEQLGAIVAQSRVDALSPEIVDRLGWTITDNLGTLAFVADAAKHDPFLRRVAVRRARAEARVPGTSIGTSLEDAAAATAYLIHFAETDDSDFRAELRASPCVMGPALALAQLPGLSGEDLIAALASGYSVQGGLAAPFGALQDNGLMSAGVWGTAAAAAVATRLLRLTPDQTAHALALATSAAGGLFQYFYDQTEEKRLILARAARAGVESALLARQGERGARRNLEGQAGLFPMLALLTGSKPDTSGIVGDVAKLDGPLYLYPKFFAASSSVLPTLEILAPLVAAGLRASDVERFALRADPIIRAPVRQKLERFEPPTTVIGSRTNYAFMVAYMLTHGAADAATMARARIDDPAVLDLARRGTFEARSGPASQLVLYLRSGDVHAITTPDIEPCAKPPLAAELRRAKFDSLSVGRLGRPRADALWDLGFQAAARPSAAAWFRRAQRLLGGS